MSRNTFAVCASLCLTLAQDAGTQYPTVAPLDEFLMADRNAESELTRSAAPGSILASATVLILEKSGHQTAVDGKNWFMCMVERSWMSQFDRLEFWNAKMRGPVCYNPATMRTILPYTVNRTKLVLAGLPKAQMRESTTAAIAKN